MFIRKRQQISKATNNLTSQQHFRLFSANDQRKSNKNDGNTRISQRKESIFDLVFSHYQQAHDTDLITRQLYKQRAYNSIIGPSLPEKDRKRNQLYLQQIEKVAKKLYDRKYHQVESQLIRDGGLKNINTDAYFNRKLLDRARNSAIKKFGQAMKGGELDQKIESEFVNLYKKKPAKDLKDDVLIKEGKELKEYNSLTQKLMASLKKDIDTQKEFLKSLKNQLETKYKDIDSKNSDIITKNIFNQPPSTRYKFMLNTIKSKDQFYNKCSTYIHRLVNNYDQTNQLDKEIKQDTQQYLSTFKQHSNTSQQEATLQLLFNLNILSNNATNLTQLLQKIREIEHVSKLDQGLLNSRMAEEAIITFLKNDAFNGVQDIAEYVERWGINIQDFNLEIFREPLKFYVWKQPDFNNVLIITNIYRLVHQQRVDSFKSENNKFSDIKISTQQEKLSVAAFNHVFREEQLLETSELYTYLVETLKGQPVINQQTQREILTDLTNFYTQNTFIFSKIGIISNPLIREQDIASFIRHKFDQGDSFSLSMQFMKSIDKQTDSTCQTLHHFLIEDLNNYLMTEKGKLPNESFSVKNIRQEYLNLLKESQNGQVFSPKLIEYLLTVMKAQGMDEELISLSEKWNKLTLSNDSTVPVYFLTDWILEQELEEGAHYYPQIQQVLTSNGFSENDPIWILMMSKAYFKDGNAQHAFDFVQQQMAQRQENEQARVASYEELYNQIFEKGANYDENGDMKKLSFEEFSQRYSFFLKRTKDLVIEDQFRVIFKSALEDADAQLVERIIEYLSLSREENLVYEQFKEEMIGKQTSPQNLRIDRSTSMRLDYIIHRKRELEQTFGYQWAEKLKNLYKLLGKHALIHENSYIKDEIKNNNNHLSGMFSFGSSQTMKLQIMNQLYEATNWTYEMDNEIIDGKDKFQDPVFDFNKNLNNDYYQQIYDQRKSEGFEEWDPDQQKWVYSKTRSSPPYQQRKPSNTQNDKRGRRNNNNTSGSGSQQIEAQASGKSEGEAQEQDPNPDITSEKVEEEVEVAADGVLEEEVVAQTIQLDEELLNVEREDITDDFDESELLPDGNRNQVQSKQEIEKARDEDYLNEEELAHVATADNDDQKFRKYGEIMQEKEKLIRNEEIVEEIIKERGSKYPRGYVEQQERLDRFQSKNFQTQIKEYKQLEEYQETQMQSHSKEDIYLSTKSQEGGWSQSQFDIFHQRAKLISNRNIAKNIGKPNNESDFIFQVPYDMIESFGNEDDGEFHDDPVEPEQFQRLQGIYEELYNGAVTQRSDEAAVKTSTYKGQFMRFQQDIIRDLKGKREKAVSSMIQIVNELQQKHLDIDMSIISESDPVKIDSHKLKKQMQLYLNHQSSTLNRTLKLDSSIPEQEESPETTVDVESLLEKSRLVNKEIKTIDSFIKKANDINLKQGYSQNKQELVNQWNEYDKQQAKELLKQEYKKYEKYVNGANALNKIGGSRQEKLSNLKKAKIDFIQEQMRPYELNLPNNFGTDLIEFGVKNDIAECVRLGEMISEQIGQQLPYPIAKLAREYKLDKSQKYSEAAKTTGPMSSLSIYKDAYMHQKSNYPGQNLIIDPEQLQKDYMGHSLFAQSHSGQWRLPSVYAYDYKPTGILGAMIGEKGADLIMKQQRKGFI